MLLIRPETSPSEASMYETLLLPLDRRKAVRIIVATTIIQCVVVWILTASVLFCFWSPFEVTADYQKLIRIMYLYDYGACRFLAKNVTIRHIILSNDTQELQSLTPITGTSPVVTISSRLANRARVHVIASTCIHVLWMVSAILLCIFAHVKTAEPRCLKLFVTVFFYVSIFVTFTDMCMAVVYISHIQQSLTNGMIIRHSGWSLEIELERKDTFGGWIPMSAAVCWLRGGVFLGVNIYNVKVISRLKTRIKKKEVKTKLAQEGNLPFPEARRRHSEREGTLYIRS